MMDASNDVDNVANFGITEEFLQENIDNLSQFKPISRSCNKRGPYSKHDKQLRRNEVLKLHFEYGYSARKISEIMRMSRNTINSDVNYWYSRLEKESESISIDATLAKITYRIESQRTRLREELDRTSGLQEKLLIDKMLFEIDNKLIQFYMKIRTSEKEIYDSATKRLNEWMKEKNYEKRFIKMEDLFSLSLNTFDKVTNLIKEDKVRTKYH